MYIKHLPQASVNFTFQDEWTQRLVLDFQFCFYVVRNIISCHHALVWRERNFFTHDFPFRPNPCFRNDSFGSDEVVQIRREDIVEFIQGIHHLRFSEPRIADPLPDDMSVAFLDEAVVILAVGP